ncbi:hypothetical protein [Streptomyces chartreusis]|uniref:hypothetical protein n=1 Tax=Streptomyces chartreusis TaxID=1969 RepID=UPI0033DA1D10
MVELSAGNFVDLEPLDRFPQRLGAAAELTAARGRGREVNVGVQGEGLVCPVVGVA